MFSKNTGYFRLTKNGDASQPYHWVLVAPNHEVILTSENYSTKQMALKGIASVRVNCSYDENYKRKRAKDGKFMFNLVARNGEVIGTSQMYTTKQAREVGIEAVKHYGKDATIKDETGEEDKASFAKSIANPPKPWLSI
jgi:uncharacterized protein YegP (UPF0339 family)